MADIIGFNEGKDFIINNDVSGLTWYFLLSSKPVGTSAGGEHAATDTLAGGVGEVTYWTGGTRLNEVVPNPTNGILPFSQKTWATGANSNGPSSVCSVVMVTTSNNTGVAIFAWNLQVGGGALPFNQVNVTLNFTPTFFLQNVGGN